MPARRGRQPRKLDALIRSYPISGHSTEGNIAARQRARILDRYRERRIDIAHLGKRAVVGRVRNRRSRSQGIVGIGVDQDRARVGRDGITDSINYLSAARRMRLNCGELVIIDQRRDRARVYINLPGGSVERDRAGVTRYWTEAHPRIRRRAVVQAIHDGLICHRPPFTTRARRRQSGKIRNLRDAPTARVAIPDQRPRVCRCASLKVLPCGEV
jgi:hypothetical protein